jgi:hypothetical protein
MKYQNYSYYKLPITMNLSEYGKVIEQFENIYIVKLTSSKMLIIRECEHDNHIKFLKNGDVIFEFRDHRIDDSTFSRIIDNTKFIFVNGTLVRTEILALNK